MSKTFILLWSLVLLIAVGCASIRRDARALQDVRAYALMTITNDQCPMQERMAAFNTLLASFGSGMKKSEMEKWLPKDSIEGRHRVGEYPQPNFTLLVKEPNGSTAFILLKGDRLN